MSKGGTAGARSRARELAVQALYQEQISAHEIDELLRQFRERPDYQRVDQAYFEENLRKVCENRADLEKNHSGIRGSATRTTRPRRARDSLTRRSRAGSPPRHSLSCSDKRSGQSRENVRRAWRPQIHQRRSRSCGGENSARGQALSSARIQKRWMSLT